MIRLTQSLWIGDSAAYKGSWGPDGQFFRTGLPAVLNVACDLSHLGNSQDDDHWLRVLDADGAEYAHVGLINGPGNELSDYCAAILHLRTLLRRHDIVLVYDHEGGTALAVAMMYLNLMGGKFRPNPLSWSHWLTWDERLTELGCPTNTLPTPHAAHVEAFGRIPYGVLEALL